MGAPEICVRADLRFIEIYDIIPVDINKGASAMTAKDKTEKIIIGTIKTIMKSRDFDVQIQPVGKNQPEVITGTSKNGGFEMKADRTKGITVETTYGQRAVFDRYSDNYITLLNLKHDCYQYHEENYYPDRNGKWVRLEKKPGFFGRLFGSHGK